MPLVFLILGLLFLVVAIRGTHADFFALIRSEFTGTNNFVIWGAALMILGAVGFVKPLRPLAIGFIVLIFLVLILTQGEGFFDRFVSALKSPVAPANGTATAPSPAPGANVVPMPGLAPVYDNAGRWIGFGR